jgi:hypothetical protein
VAVGVGSLSGLIEGRQNIALGNGSGKDFLQSTGAVVIGSYSGELDTGVSLNNSIILASGADPSSKLILNSSGALSFSDVYTGANYGTVGQVLQSNGPSARPTWVNAGGYQAYAIARQSTRTTVTSGSYGSAVVIYDTIIASNPIAVYNALNGQFRPTLAGFWSIQASARCFAGQSLESNVSLLKNGSTICSTGSYGQVNGTVTAVVYFNGTTDNASVSIVTQNGASNNQGTAYFSAFYVGN